MNVRISTLVIAAGLVSAVATVATLAGQVADPLPAEIAHWRQEAARDLPGETLWSQIQPGAQTALTQAAAALEQGRRWLALERLAAARSLLSSSLYVVRARPEVRRSVAAFEAEWARAGATFGRRTQQTSADRDLEARPAAVRALTETAALQTHILYDASLEYGRATDSDSGLFYLGSALAQQQFLRLARQMPPGSAASPLLRSIRTEIEALQRRLLVLYQPPVSIERHPEVIAASAAIKEARELDAAGQRYGALFKFLQATQRVAALTPDRRRPTEALRSTLAEADQSLAADGRDHSLVHIFLERAAMELEKPLLDEGMAVTVSAILDDVVPAYHAALGAAPAPVAPVAAEVTVRLIRWPFT